MKEVFTKTFWEGVKKTFDEAREGPPPADNTAGGTVSDGREEREEREKRIEQEKQKDRQDQVNREDLDEWKPERVDS
jgi:hypothetical protein